MLQSLLPKKKKPEEEEDKNSLLSRAFTAKSTTTDPNKAPLSSNRVATYRDPYAKLRRQALRALLTIVLPFLGLLSIVLVTFNVIATNIKEAPTSVETVTMANVPLPTGVRRLGSVALGSNTNYFQAQTENWVRGYGAKTTAAESYIVNLTPNDLIQYYRGKILANKQWQIQRQLGLPSSFDTLYVRGLTNGQIEGIYLQILVGPNDDLLKIKDPEAGGTRFNVAKLTIYRKQ
jgi:hypothetical protein